MIFELLVGLFILLVLVTVKQNLEMRRRGLKGPLILPVIGTALYTAWYVVRGENPIAGRHTLFSAAYEKFGKPQCTCFLQWQVTLGTLSSSTRSYLSPENQKL
jgi:hypothetical protein